MKRLNENSWMGRCLAWVAARVTGNGRLIVIVHAVLFVICVLYTVRFLEFDTRRDNLVGSNKKYHQNYMAFKREFPEQDDLVVVAESENPEKNRQFVERLGAKLEAETNIFVNVFYKGDLKMMGSKALLFVPDADLVNLQAKLKDYGPFIQQFARTTNLVSLFDMVNSQFRTAKRETNGSATSLVSALPALNRILQQADACMNRSGTPPSPGITALFDPSGQAEKDAYITFANGQIYLVTAQAAREGLNREAVQRLRQLVDETKTEISGLNVGLTGEPVLEHDEMAQSQTDTTVASIVSLIVCALIFIYGYQETGRPVKATICLVVGLAFTLAFGTLSVGHLNILTITFVPILIGLAIDYGVHLITRYEEELRHGKTEKEALKKAMVFTGQGIITGAFTTAGAFLAMGLTNFKGIQEMGIICGGGLLVCLVPMLVLLPVLLLRGRQNVIDHSHSDISDTRAKIENFWLQRPFAVCAVTGVLFALAASQLHKVRFDYDLLNMQSKGLPAVEYEQKLINSASKSVLYAAVVADSLDEAVRIEGQITNLHTVARKGGVVSIAGFLKQDQEEKLRVIGEIKRDLSSLQFSVPDARPVDITDLTRTLYSLYGYCGAALDEIGTNRPALSRQFTALRETIEKFRKQMLSGSPTEWEVRSRKLAAFQQALFNDLRETFFALKTQDNSSALRVADLPPALRNRFVGVTGKFLIQVYPEKDVWQRENQEEFINELTDRLDPQRTNHPIITGTPVQLYYYTELLKVSYEQAALYSLGAIVILVFIHFRTLSSVILALLPVGIGSVWLGGLMGVFGISLNPANIMTLPLVIGIGVTNGIHILNRFAEEQQAGILSRSTGKAVLVSGLTAIAGFGSLILAKHQGIRSLGYVMSIGIGMCMLAGLTFLPALLSLILRHQAEKNRPSAGKNRPGSEGTELET
ncbi:MAG: MMPL family transporter [Verrucomicrobiota bacterium]